MTVETRAAVLSAMAAARPYAQSRPLSVETVRLAPPGPGEVRVAIRAAGLSDINSGFDRLADGEAARLIVDVGL